MENLGIDVSKAKFDACMLVNGKHRVKAFDNTLKGFRQLKKWIESHEQRSIHACMEGTGRLWEPLAEFLHAENFVVSVVNPARIKGYALSELRRSKTDSLDAQIIARFCRAQSPRAWMPPPPEVKAVRDRQRYIDALKDSRIRENNRLKSGVLDPLVEAAILRHIEYLEEEIRSLEQELLKFVKSQSDLKRSYELLTSIIGVGQVTAITFLGELSSAVHFASARELEVFCGLTPRVHESGSSVRSRTKISKMGNRRIRKALYMPAVSAMRTNPIMREFAQRLKDRGKPGKVVVCAVMRKLLRTMYAVLKSNRSFDPEFRSTRSPTPECLAATVS